MTFAVDEARLGLAAEVDSPPRAGPRVGRGRLGGDQATRGGRGPKRRASSSFQGRPVFALRYRRLLRSERRGPGFTLRFRHGWQVRRRGPGTSLRGSRGTREPAIARSSAEDPERGRGLPDGHGLQQVGARTATGFLARRRGAVSDLAGEVADQQDLGAVDRESPVLEAADELGIVVASTEDTGGRQLRSAASITASRSRGW